MKKILLAFFLFFALSSQSVYSQGYPPNVDTVRTIVGNPVEDVLPPGRFKPPFKCGQGTYYGLTYAGHSRYSVDFNRGSGTTDRGDPVLASANGTVYSYIPAYGDIRIRHADGYETWYVHMQNIRVKKGDSVKLGQQIGEIGSKYPGHISPHLHVNHARYGKQIKVAYDGVPYPASVLSASGSFRGPGIKGECQTTQPPPTPPPPPVDVQDIVTWGQTIVNGLTVRPGCTQGIYNKQQQNISNNGFKVPVRSGTCEGRDVGVGATYFCTNLVSSSYNLAGYRNSFSTNTYDMFQSWQKRPGYRVIKDVNNQSAIRQLRPGDAIFMFVPPFRPSGLKHIVLVKDIQIDNNGSGHIRIIQANGVAKELNYPVRKWKIKFNYRGNPNSGMHFGLGPR